MLRHLLTCSAIATIIALAANNQTLSGLLLTATLVLGFAVLLGKSPISTRITRFETNTLGRETAAAILPTIRTAATALPLCEIADMFKDRGLHVSALDIHHLLGNNAILAKRISAETARRSLVEALDLHLALHHPLPATHEKHYEKSPIL